MTGKGIYFDKKVQLFLGDILAVLFEFNGYLKRKEQLVFFENTNAAVIVDVHCERVHNVGESFFQIRIGYGLSQRILKHVQVGRQRVLVHSVHGRQIGQHEKEYGTAFGRRSIAVS